MTFSICVREETDAGTVFGAGVATGAPAVGAFAPYATENGVVCTQSFVNVRIGRRGVEFLDDLAVDDAVEGLLAQDDHAELRQAHGLDRRGNHVAVSGEGCDGWFGHRVADDGEATAAGNMLANGETLDAMLAARELPAEDTVECLLNALDAGKEAGGDKRGHTSAAVTVWAPQTTAYHDLRVDHHETPIEELRGVYERTKATSGDFSEDSKSRIFD